MNDSLKLTAYFAERQRTGSRFLAEAMLDLFAERHVTTSVMLRGISGFGYQRIIRTDESLTLSEDPSVAIAAVDSPETIGAVADEVAALTADGLITVERAQLLDGNVDVTDTDTDTDTDTVKLTVYLGRKHRVDSAAAFRAVCDVLYRNGFAGASVFLGVDGTVHGERRRAHFIGRNTDVPLMIIAVGTAAQVQASRTELAAILRRPLVTVERITLCKHSGALIASPPSLPETDDRGRTLWQKLMVFTSEASRHDGAPIHRALVRRLWESRAATGATVLRGIWGYQDGREPHGDKLIQFGRQVPVMTVIVGSPASVTRSFEIVDEVTDQHGLVTCETVPALLSLTDGGQRGGIDLADYRY